MSSKASGGTVTFKGAEGAPATLEETLDAMLLDAIEEATEEATEDATEEETLDATEDVTDDATEEATEDAADEDTLLAAGLYEHQVELLGAPGKLDSWQTKLPVKVA